MPAELATPLSFERPKETDSKVRTEAAEALYLLAVQVPSMKIHSFLFQANDLSMFFTGRG